MGVSGCDCQSPKLVPQSWNRKRLLCSGSSSPANLLSHRSLSFEAKKNNSGEVCITDAVCYTISRVAYQIFFLSAKSL